MKELLIVVDYQKDFVDGALGFAGAEALDGPIAQRIAQVRAGGGDVIFTMDTHGADYAMPMISLAKFCTMPKAATWASP